MKNKTKLCAIGCGRHASKFHYPALAEMEDVELAGLAELSEEQRQVGIENFGFRKAYNDYAQMLEKEKPDAVYVIMPPEHTFTVSRYCLSQGYNVFCEKPPGLTVFQTRVLLEIAKDKGCITQVGFQRKFVPLVQKMREMVEKKGRIDQIAVTFCKNAASTPPMVADMLTLGLNHLLDVMLWLASSEPEKVASVVYDSYKDNNVLYNALVLFENGVSSTFLGNYNSGRRYSQIEIQGNACVATTDIENIGTYYDKDNPDGITVTAEEAAGSDKPHRVLGFYDQSRDFIDCVRTGSKPTGCLENALKTMELGEKIYTNAINQKGICK
ncbi:MAG: Gfo/Idh/MocA family oxidoreductase [Planctomycetota bacterium]